MSTTRKRPRDEKTSVPVSLSSSTTSLSLHARLGGNLLTAAQEEEHDIIIPEPTIPPYLPIRFLSDASRLEIKSDLTLQEKENNLNFKFYLENSKNETILNQLILHNVLLSYALRDPEQAGNIRFADVTLREIETLYKKMGGATTIKEQNVAHFSMAMSYLGKISIIYFGMTENRFAETDHFYKKAHLVIRKISDVDYRNQAVLALVMHRLQAFSQQAAILNFIFDFSKPGNPGEKALSLLDGALEQFGIYFKGSKPIKNFSGLIENLFVHVLELMDETMLSLGYTAQDVNQFYIDTANELKNQIIHPDINKEELIAFCTKKQPSSKSSADQKDEKSITAHSSMILPSEFELDRVGERLDGFCFDAAIGLVSPDKGTSPREPFLNFVRAKIISDEQNRVCQILAPEILNAALLTVSFLQESPRSSSQQNQSQIKRIKIVDGFGFIEEFYELHFQKDSFNQGDLLPRSMHTDKLTKLTNNYFMTCEKIQRDPVISWCCNELGLKKIIPITELQELFDDLIYRKKYQAVYDIFEKTKKESGLTDAQHELFEYCRDPEVCMTYINDYYGSETLPGWVVVAKKLHCEQSTQSCIIDLYAEFINQQIIIYEGIRKIYQTIPIEGSGSVHVYYNGRDHYIRLKSKTVSTPSPALSAEIPPINFSSSSLSTLSSLSSSSSSSSSALPTKVTDKPAFRH